MSLIAWDQDPSQLVSFEHLDLAGFPQYFTEIGKQPMPGTRDRLAAYILSFDTVRSSLAEHDPVLAQILGISLPIKTSTSTK
jgi:hypothetical protein